MNIHLPSAFRSITEDYDIYSSKPKQDARNLERQLDRKAGCKEAFYTKKGVNRGTWKVKRHDGSGVADYTKPRERVPTVRKRGVRYSTLEYERMKRQQMLKDKKMAWKHDKAREDLARMRLKRMMRR